MNEYPNNSHKYKEEQKKKSEEKREIKKVVQGSAKVKEKSKVSKLANVFISEDANNVKSYVIMDVIIPAAKKLISDIVRDGIDMILYGTSGRSKAGSSGTKISYRSYYDKKDDRAPVSSYSSQGRFDLDDVEFESRRDAEAVYDQMREVIGRYGIVTVGDMYEMARLPQPYTSNKYGWMNIDNSEIVRLRGGGYVIKLPKAAPID